MQASGICGFLCCHSQSIFLHRCQYAEIALDSPIVVVANITLNHLHERILTVKPFSIVRFPFQDAPEAFHRPVVDASAYTGHALLHPSLFQLVVEGPARVLESSVTVEERMCVRIGRDCPVEGLVNQRVIVALADHIRHDASVEEVKDGARPRQILCKRQEMTV